MYPVGALVKEVRDAVQQVQQNVQAPLALCAVSALSHLAAAAQDKIKVIMPWGGDPKQVGTYWAVIAESGERKSTVDGIFGKEIGLHDLLRANTYSMALDQYETDYRVWRKGEQTLVCRIADQELKGEHADDLREQLVEHIKRKPTKPRLRRRIRQDMSERAIMDALEGSGESIALICDEGEVLLRSAVLNKPSLLNKAWDGGPFHFDRKDRNIVAADTRSSVSVMVQSTILKAYLDKRGDVVRGSGMWARFLMCWPLSTQGWRYTSHAESTWELLEAFQLRIREILNDDTQYVYEFDADAKTELINLLNQIEPEIRPWGGYLSDISDFASKAGENTARIAALFHHASRQTGKISVDTLKRAWEIVKWHLEETKRIFTPSFDVPQLQADAVSVEAYLRTYIFKVGAPNSVPQNVVLKSGPIRGQGAGERFRDALRYLEGQQKIWISRDSKRKCFINIGRQWYWS